MNAIKKSYQAENLTGSYCTAPLRSYNNWFQNKIQASDGARERTAWKIGYAVSAIFAYLTLGVLAVVGIAINLCLIPPKNGYSLWARLNGIPGVTEWFCEKLHRDLSSTVDSAGSVINFASSPGGRHYTYNLNHQLSFPIPGAYKDNLPALHPSPATGESEEKGEAIPLQQSEPPAQACFQDMIQARLQRMNQHIPPIQACIQSLSQKYSWYPERYQLRTMNDEATVTIPLPDHIPVPNLAHVDR